jgi:hypothetical protein
MPYLLVAVPSLVLATLILLLAKDPPRWVLFAGCRGLLPPNCPWTAPDSALGLRACTGATPLTARPPFQKPNPPRGAYEEALQHQYAEGRAYEETISWAKAKEALRAPSNILLIMQAVPGCLPWGVIGAYLNDYFSQVGGGG